MYKIAICDDNKAYLELVESRIQKYCRENHLKIVLDSFEDSDMLAEYVGEKKLYDAYILDIEMPNLSGVKLAEKIRESSECAYIIFLTAYETYAIKACGINVLNYVLKEQMEEELDSVLVKLFERLGRLKDDKVYVISNQRKYVKIQQKDILYIYKDQKNAVFVLDGMEEERERITLQEVYQKLDHTDLVLLDRGIILNMQHVRKIVDDRVIMKGGHELTTSKIHANELKEHLLTYWGGII